MTVMPASKSSRINDGHHGSSQAGRYQDRYSSPSYMTASSRLDHQTFNNRHYKSSPAVDARHERSAHSLDRKKERRDDKYRSVGSHSSNESVSRSNHGGGTARPRDDRDDEEKHKAEVAKSALHVCGDWTSHKSSSGKVYFYNCKTEVSQWEKPKGWKEPITSSKNTPKEKLSRHVDNHVTSSQSKKVEHHKPVNGERRDANRHVPQKVQAQRRLLSSSHSSTQSSLSTELKPPPKENGSSHRPNESGNSQYEGGQLTVTQRAETLDERLKRMISDGTDDARKRSSPSDAPDAKRKRTNSTKPDTVSPRENSGQESVPMDISPTPSPNGQPHQRPTSQQKRSTVVSTTGMSIPTIVSGQTRQQAPPPQQQQQQNIPSISQDITVAAMRTLLKLQRAIATAVSSSSQQPSTQASPRVAAPTTRSQQEFTSPPPAATTTASSTTTTPAVSSRVTGEEHVSESPRSEHSTRSSGSVPSNTSRQQSNSSSAQANVLSAAAAPSQPSYNRVLDADALKQHVQDTLTTHVQGWHGTSFERDADRHARQYHELMTRKLSGDLAARLKCSRSVVRDHELQISLTQLRFDSLEERLASLEDQRTAGGSGSAYLPPPVS